MTPYSSVIPDARRIKVVRIVLHRPGARTNLNLSVQPTFSSAPTKRASFIAKLALLFRLAFR